MADEIETIADAIEVAAKEITKRSKEGDREEDKYSIDDLIKADRHVSGKAASGKSHFGLRFVKCIPPGGG